MNIQLSIYEIFSTIIPGMIYLVAFGELLRVTKIVPWDWQLLSNLSFTSSLGLLVVAYLLGIAFNRLGIFWKGIFKTENQSLEALTRFKQRHKDQWIVDIGDKDWNILLAYIRSRSIDLAREIERHLAASIMLRNVSLGLFLISLISVGESYFFRNAMLILSGLVWLIFSFMMLRESAKFRRWYYDTILSTMVSYRFDLEKSIKPVVAPLKKPNAKRQEN